MSKKQKPKKSSHTNRIKEPDNKKQIESIEELLVKRTGGAINLRGIAFQLLYAAYCILSELKRNTYTTVRLEGLEDIDIINGEHKVYIQTKTSINTLDASKLWSLKVFQTLCRYMRLIKKQNSNLFIIHPLAKI